jgi:adenine-specific DNA-methyltransferase
MTDLPEFEEDRDNEMEPTRLDLRSADVIEPRIRELADLFPEAVEDGKLDVDSLRAALGDVAEHGPERFGLTWPGKGDAIRMAQRRAEGTLVPMKDESVEWETTKNVIIEGENLEVLKLLQRSYHGKVKLIYIDPPYNTGKDFVYPDNFREPLEDYLRYSGQVGENGGRLRANAETGGRYHSAWLSMMWPRLHLARSLLLEEGVIAVSIDDHEVHNLRTLLNEVFGEENFIATVIWHKMDSPKNSARHFSEDHEYLLIYARNAETWRPNLVRRSDEMVARYKNPDSDPRGPWLLGDLAARNVYSEGRYPITTPSGRVIEGPPPGSYWRINRERFDALDRENRIWWGGGDVRPGIKRFLSEVRDGVVPQTYWHWSEVGSTRNAKREFSELLGAEHGQDLFVTPKPTGLLRRLLEITTDEASLVLDFFAGSGSMGHAVLSENARDGGYRRFIMVQFPEPQEGGNLETIAALTRERMRAAANDVLRRHGDSSGLAPQLDAGFRSYELATTALTRSHLREPDDPTSLFVDAVDHGRDDEALLTELLLARGFDLAEQVVWREIAGAQVADVAEGALLVCFTREMTSELFEALVDLEPAQLILLEAGFGGNDEVKVNALQHLKTANAHRQTPIELLVV